MNITLYSCGAEVNMLDKTGFMESVATYSGAVARIDVSIMNPVLMLEETASNINFANYCYITEFGRYYYIVDKSCGANGMWTLRLKCDVLMSFKEGIKLQKGIVSKNTNIYNMYLPGNIKTETRPVVSTIQFAPTQDSYAFTNQASSIVLLGIGGK